MQDLTANVTVLPQDAAALSADIIRGLKDRLTSDFLVIPADLYMDVPLHSVLNFHRIQDPLLLSVYYPAPTEKGKETGKFI